MRKNVISISGPPIFRRLLFLRTILSISYGITLYNKAKYISRVLDAVLAECRRTGGEIIIYDDVSTDESVEIVRAKLADGPIRLIEGDRNRGVVAATERLIREARQPLLRLVDADDEIVAGSSGFLAAALERHDAILAVGGCVDRPAEPVPVADNPSSALVPEPFKRYARGIDFNLSGALMRTAGAVAILPLPTELRLAQDVCVALRLARRGAVARVAAIASLQPNEIENRLSRRVAAMYRDICLVLAAEIERSPAADAAAIVRRQAARCLRYFRREAPAALTRADRLALYRHRWTSPLCPLPTAQTRLRRIARIYAGDEQRVLGRAA
jgi:glycosyltransferase involved in cell wall biosynthesis